jgi:CrcB protein
MLKTYLVVMLGGGLGAVARVWLSLAIATRWGESFPFGTLVVNVSGCFVIGLFAALTGPDGLLLTSPLVRQGVMLGILGGFTTFSSFSLQTVALLKEGELMFALLNMAGSLAGCVVATWLGLAIGNWFNPK